MFSANDIRSVEFETDRKGYNIEDVRAFLGQIADQFDSVNSDKEEAEGKIEALGEKIEEYRKDEDSLKLALLGAQKMADSMVQEAREKADALIEEATQRAERLVADANARVEGERDKLNELKKATGEFKLQIKEIYAEHIKMIGDIPEFSVSGEQISGKSIEQKPVKAEPEKAVEPAEEPAESRVEEVEEEVVEPDLDFSAFRSESTRHADADRSSSRFGKLDFGDGYSVRE